jgi:hypothetical protein
MKDSPEYPVLWSGVNGLEILIAFRNRGGEAMNLA